MREVSAGDPPARLLALACRPRVKLPSATTPLRQYIWMTVAVCNTLKTDEGSLDGCIENG